MAIFFRSKVASDRCHLTSVRWAVAVLAAIACLTDSARAQVPPPPNPSPPLAPEPVGAQPLQPSPAEIADRPVAPRFSEESEIPSSLPRVSISPPRPLQGPRSVGAMVEGLKGNDAAFDVLVNQARILTLKQDITAGPGRPLVAVGDPTIVDFTIISPRQLRLNGRGIGVTDLSITTAQNETIVFEIRVLADLTLIQGKLRSTFPDASIQLSQVRDHIVLEGEARDPMQIARIEQTLRAYLASVFVQQGRTVAVGQTGQILNALGSGGALGAAYGVAGGPGAGGASPGQVGTRPGAGGVAPGTGGLAPGMGLTMPGGLAVAPGAFGGGGFAPYATSAELGGPAGYNVQGVFPQIINLMRVAGSQQVMLKVRIAELNRTALRRIGANFLGIDPRTGGIVGSIIGGPTNFQGVVGQPGSLGFGAGNITTGSNVLSSSSYFQGAPYQRLFGSAEMAQNGLDTTVFGIFQHAGFEFTLGALRQNGLLKILAEPNLVALNGQTASFLAGGEFPVPVPQVAASGVAPTITVRFREFGVRLGFVPYILDGGVIRLTVAPEVSNIDQTIAVTLVAGGTPVPGLNTRKAQTTVELREGQTLAMAGLLQLTLNGQTNRIPGLGDLPILGPFFSNTSSQRIEKELVVLVTPYLIEPMNPGQVPPTPGDEVKEPNDLELYLLNRIEARTGKDFRSTTEWDDPWGLRHHLNLEKKYVNGPVGFSD
jgi:pilus assembly protein CpaC